VANKWLCWKWLCTTAQCMVGTISKQNSKLRHCVLCTVFADILLGCFLLHEFVYFWLCIWGKLSHHVVLCCLSWCCVANFCILWAPSICLFWFMSSTSLTITFHWIDVCINQMHVADAWLSLAYCVSWRRDYVIRLRELFRLNYWKVIKVIAVLYLLHFLCCSSFIHSCAAVTVS